MAEGQGPRIRFAGRRHRLTDESLWGRESMGGMGHEPVMGSSGHRLDTEVGYDQAEPEASSESPATVPTLQDHARKLAPLGWTGREAEWLALVALHSGAFTRSQWCEFFDGANREAARVFVRGLIEKKLAFEDERPIFPGGARAVLLTGKPLYHALGIPDVRHRRSKDATTVVLTRRLLSLDYIIERPTFGWLPTEADKVRRFGGARAGPAHLPVPAVRPRGHTADPALFCVQAADRRRRPSGDLRVHGRSPNDR